MALIFMDGMDVYGVTADLSTRYDSVSTNIAYGAAIGRFGGGGIIVSDDDKYIQKAVTGFPQTGVVSFGVFRTTTTPGADIIWRFDNSVAGGGVTVKTLGTAGTMEVFKGTATSLGTFTLSANVWHWVSCKYKAANTGGTFDVEVDGTNVFSFTGDTVNSGTEDFRDVLLGGDIVQDFTYDDVIITDVSGAAPFNDLLSDRRIDTILPNAAGDSSGFTASPVVANFLNVDDTAPDGDTTHVEANVSTTKDLYNMASMGFSPAGIDAVNVVAQASNPDAGTPGVKLKVKSGTTEGTGASQTPSSGYGYIDELFLLNPDTSAAWTETEVNAMQAGQEIT